MKASLVARRNFFFATACASWTLHALGARSAEPPRAIGLGFSLYGMKSIELNAALRALAEIGYDCAELPVMEGWPGDSARLSREARSELREGLKRRGMRLTALMENLPALGDDARHRANLERLKRAAELARDLAPEEALAGKLPRPLIETILGGKPGEFEAVKGQLVDRLRDWTKVVADAGVTLAIKAHVGNATQVPDQLLWLLEEVASPWLKATYDYSHFQLQSLALKSTLEQLASRTVFIHVKDTEHALGKKGFLLPGEGTIDYRQFFEQLVQTSYGGDVVVEVSSQVFNRAGYDPLAAASKCYNRLADACSRAGVPRG
jgi:sugar phosphate isomerase/epimerase